MTGEKPPDTAAPKSGTRIDYPPTARPVCAWCHQPRNPLFLATRETHDLEGDGVDPEVCARCWSIYHRDAEKECPHCGKRLDEEPLW